MRTRKNTCVLCAPVCVCLHEECTSDYLFSECLSSANRWSLYIQIFGFNTRSELGNKFTSILIKVRNKLLGWEDFSHVIKIELGVFWIFFFNAAFIMCHSSHSIKACSWSKHTAFRTMELSGDSRRCSGGGGCSSAAISGNRLSWGESLLLNSSRRVNRHMLLPAKHAEQLLLLAGNPQGAHTKSINCLLRWLRVVMQHLIFHQLRDLEALGCVAFWKQNIRLS